jgi:hypothetical protein
MVLISAAKITNPIHPQKKERPKCLILTAVNWLIKRALPIGFLNFTSLT